MQRYGLRVGTRNAGVLFPTRIAICPRALGRRRSVATKHPAASCNEHTDFTAGTLTSHPRLSELFKQPHFEGTSTEWDALKATVVHVNPNKEGCEDWPIVRVICPYCTWASTHNVRGGGGHRACDGPVHSKCTARGATRKNWTPYECPGYTLEVGGGVPASEHTGVWSRTKAFFTKMPVFNKLPYFTPLRRGFTPRAVDGRWLSTTGGRWDNNPIVACDSRTFDTITNRADWDQVLRAAKRDGVLLVALWYRKYGSRWDQNNSLIPKLKELATETSTVAFACVDLDACNTDLVRKTTVPYYNGRHGYEPESIEPDWPDCREVTVHRDGSSKFICEGQFSRYPAGVIGPPVRLPSSKAKDIPERLIDRCQTNWKYPSQLVLDGKNIGSRTMEVGIHTKKVCTLREFAKVLDRG